MHLTTLATLLASAITLSGSAYALPAPDSLANPLDPNTLSTRAPKNSNFCTGSSTGSSSGAYACVAVTWAASKTQANIKLTVDDSRGDSNDVYGYYRVYFADGKHQDSPKLRDGRGYAATTPLPDRVRSFEKSGIVVTGVRVYACVDDAGSDSCTDRFVRSPFFQG
ncbi:hypothetical protein Slin15195_G126260 [Septoria linicola]|uniref:Uncharacterized protein n=1 Tax=Septoria linicola TaxID=215465 RepID=A0A9Q9B8L5_9PEZI|nr:hypothetical protein Slin14017_G082440 [Septoria linicola]USW59307.1 hypothetical protein Slin15195_G126260 [Septoria linicola]